MQGDDCSMARWGPKREAKARWGYCSNILTMRGQCPESKVQTEVV